VLVGVGVVVVVEGRVVELKRSTKKGWWGRSRRSNSSEARGNRVR
jgi:hypothetical protein